MRQIEESSSGTGGGTGDGSTDSSTGDGSTDSSTGDGSTERAGATETAELETSELDDIPGTTVFTAARSRKGYWLNQFCVSLMNEEKRARFQADEDAYLDEWPLSEAQKRAVRERDYNAAIAEGGNIYFLAKLFLSDGKTFQDAAGSMTGMTPADYAAMMLDGGRKPDGWRSRKEGR